MASWTVKFFNTTKWFWFIKPDNGWTDLYVDSSSIIDQIKDNDKVTFEVEEWRKGPMAKKVKLA